MAGHRHQLEYRQHLFDQQWRQDLVRHRLILRSSAAERFRQSRPRLRCARPHAPDGVGNLGNFIYVGTATGQIYVTQDGGGSGTVHH